MQCDRCKRHLNPTMHSREGYRVEAYRLYTGHAVPLVLREDGDVERKFMKIENPRIVVICDRCLEEKEVAEAVEKFEPPAGI